MCTASVTVFRIVISFMYKKKNMRFEDKISHHSKKQSRHGYIFMKSDTMAYT